MSCRKWQLQLNFARIPRSIFCVTKALTRIFSISWPTAAPSLARIISEQDGERILRIAVKGDLVGEMALIQNTPRSATVRTITDCTVLEMDQKGF